MAKQLDIRIGGRSFLVYHQLKHINGLTFDFLFHGTTVVC